MKNWFKRYKIADMPLPEATDYPNTSHYLLEKYDSLISQETVDELKIKYPNLKYIGQGSFNIAYDTGKGTVLKMLSDFNEYSIYKKYKDINISCIVKILDIFRIGYVFFAEMEKIRLLNIEEKSIINKIRDFYFINFMFINNDKSVEEIYGYTRHHLKVDEELLLKYIYFIKCLWNNGFSDLDAHYNNIGYNSNGDLVLFDLGGSQ